MLREKKFKLSLLGLGILGGWLIVGCGSGSNSGDGTPVTGTVMFGPVSGATVSAFPISPTTGAADTSMGPLATATTDANGNYSLNIGGNSSTVVLQATGGTYVEEHTGNTVAATGQTISSVLNVTPGSTAISAITPFTDAAAQQVQTTVTASNAAGTSASQPVDVSKTVTNTNYAMSNAIGITDIQVPPANPFKGVVPNDDTGRYAAVIAGVSAAATDINATVGGNSTTPTVTSLDVTKAMSQHLSTSGASLATLGTSSITVTKSSGEKVTITPPSIDTLSNKTSSVVAGTTPMAGFTPPKTLTLNTMTSTPPTTAPAGFVSGAVANKPKASTTTAAPLNANAPTPGSTAAIAAAKAAIPTVSNTIQGACTITAALTSISSGKATTTITNACADIYLTSSVSKSLSDRCSALALNAAANLPIQSGSVWKATGSYKASTTCAAATIGTCISPDASTRMRFYNISTTLSGASTYNTGSSLKTWCTTPASSSSTAKGTWQ